MKNRKESFVPGKDPIFGREIP